MGDASMGAINAVADLTLEGEIAILTLNSPPVNALSHAVREGIHSGIKQAIGDGNVKAIVLICEGKTFIAGADITEFGKPPQAPNLIEVEDVIENSPKPVVAAIHGTALGGLEVTLCCH
jgi:3-hydroxyacyl-CoA dehydrogenase